MTLDDLQQTFKVTVTPYEFLLQYSYTKAVHAITV